MSMDASEDDSLTGCVAVKHGTVANNLFLGRFRLPRVEKLPSLRFGWLASCRRCVLVIARPRVLKERAEWFGGGLRRPSSALKADSPATRLECQGMPS
jgi:hypothetical protein